MTPQEIDKYFEKLQEKNRWIRLYSSYAYGDNYKIKHKEDEPKPDNKIPVPLAKSAITDVVGYAGRPNEIITEYVHILASSKEEDDDITELLTSFDEHNKEGLENSELLTKALSLGMAWELWYISDDMQLSNGMQTPEYKILKNEECLPVWSRDIKPKLEKFLRFWCDDDYDHLDIYYPGKEVFTEYGERLSLGGYSERYSKKKKLDDGKTGDWTRDIPGDIKYPYTEVPVIPFKINMRDEPIFKAQLPLLDAYDSAMSKMANEVDRFNAAIILLAGLMASEDKQKLLEGKTAIFDDLGQFSENGNLSAAISYLTKNLAGVEGFYKEFLDRDERHFRETIKIPNMQDQEFAGNQSGVAIRYKLIGLEFLVSEIEVYFRQGLEKRFKMYQDIINESTVTVNWDEYEQKISWKRNLPVDDKEKVEIAAMLIGLGLTLDKVIQFLPNAIVENMTDDEIAQMLEDKQTEQVNRNQPEETNTEE